MRAARAGHGADRRWRLGRQRRPDVPRRRRLVAPLPAGRPGDARSLRPRSTWSWERYDWRRQRIAACAPNDAHHVLARWARRPGVTLVTQNVDGLHERAGAAAAIRLHGSIWEVRCARGCAGGRESRRLETVPLETLPPPCPHCGGDERPGVVWFGNRSTRRCSARPSRRPADATCSSRWARRRRSTRRRGCWSRRNAPGRRRLRCNPDETPLMPYLDVAVRQPAERFLPLVDAAL